MFGKYMVAHLLGITREHEKQFRDVEMALTKDGFICFAPVIYDFDVYQKFPEMLNNMCYEKLLVCDFCVLVTPEHIGRSTTDRILQAIDLGKPVYVWYNGAMATMISNEDDLKEVKEDYVYACTMETVGDELFHHEPDRYLSEAGLFCPAVPDPRKIITQL